jgi:phosphoribosylamine--glycine ligase
MNVLVIGGGGREHAITWKLRQSPCVTDLHVAPATPAAAIAHNVDLRVPGTTSSPDVVSICRLPW